ncbi:predicted protein [Streptomyces iranensis]|uniref:PPM-type phosphatase domain-containing protein n=1 Tax=Streptomyces iranensis TaxID=576784 RepID=A0A060ZZT1_9ACTN|nr:predicted protein [Streptomyces iranensis]
MCCLGFAEERIFEPEEQAVMMMMADLLGQALDALDVPADVPLGVHSATPFRAYETTLAPGSLLLLYTDGLTPGQSSEAVAGVRTLLAAGSRDNDGRGKTVWLELSTRDGA